MSYTVLSNESGIQVYYGTRWQNAEIIKKSLSNVLEKASVENDWICLETLNEYQKYGAFLVGSGVSFPSGIDRILSALDGKRFMLNVFARPISMGEINMEAERVEHLSESLQMVERTENTYGTQRRRISAANNMDVSEALDTLSAARRRLSEGLQTGLWETAVFISAPTSSERDQCALVFSTLLSNVRDERVEGAPTCIVRCMSAFAGQSSWSIPTVSLFHNPLPGLYRKSLANILTTNDLATIISPPGKEHRGYAVRHMGESAKSITPFSLFPPAGDSSREICLGRISTNEPFTIRIDDLRQHALVTGATQYGKSTTVKKMLIGAKSAQIPFIVIEAAKKDYWKLIKQSELQSLRVYSGGKDGLPLRINPFQPEVGTVLDYHIQGLIAVFLSLFNEDEPLPQIIQEMVYVAYEKFGWDTKSRITGMEERQYPTILDMLENLDESMCLAGNLCKLYDPSDYYEQIHRQMLYDLYNKLSNEVRT